MAGRGEVIDIYKGVKIRRCNEVTLRFGVAEFKRIIDACEQSGLSIQKVLYYSGRPCERCDHEITVYGTDGIGRRIKKGLLNLPESNGINIIQKAKNRKNGK